MHFANLNENVHVIMHT